MGKLVNQKELGLDPDWYFSDAYYARYDGNGRYNYAWPSPDFPHCHHINVDHLNNSEKIRIRRWIENNISDTVIYDYLDLGYRRHYGEDRDWDSGFDIKNTWMRFHFEDKETALMFKMVFLNLINVPTKHHPDKPEDEEWCNTPIGER
jgi:hypothetical protein